MFDEKIGEVKFIIYAILALFILVLLAYGIYSFASERAIPFAEYLPDFMKKDVKIEGVEKLRYQIIYDNLQYYDKNDWRNFKNGRVELNGKIVDEKEVKRVFKERYFSFNSRTPGDEGQFRFILNTPDVLNGVFKRGDVFIFFKIDEKNESLVLDNYNNIKRREIKRGFWSDKDILSDVDLNLEIYKNAKEKGIEWRDSALKKPIEIKYYFSGIEEKEESDSVFVCIGRKGADLVIDLGDERVSC